MSISKLVKINGDVLAVMFSIVDGGMAIAALSKVDESILFLYTYVVHISFMHEILFNMPIRLR